MTLAQLLVLACPQLPDQGAMHARRERRIRRWEHEAVLDAMQHAWTQPEMMRVRRQTVEHPFGTIKFWMGWTHFLTKTLERVSTEMSLHVLAYNIKRVMRILGIGADDASDESLSREGSYFARYAVAFSWMRPRK